MLATVGDNTNDDDNANDDGLAAAAHYIYIMVYNIKKKNMKKRKWIISARS